MIEKTNKWQNKSEKQRDLTAQTEANLIGIRILWCNVPWLGVWRIWRLVLLCERGPKLSAASWMLLPNVNSRETLYLHLASSCSSKAFTSLSGVFTLSVLTIHVGRWRLSMRMSCCRSSLSSSIWAFRSEFNISSLSDSYGTEGKGSIQWRKFLRDVCFSCCNRISHF